MAASVLKKGPTRSDGSPVRTSLRSKPSKKDEFDRLWSPERRRAVEEYLAAVQVALRLQDWTISVDWSKPAKDALATCTPMGDSRHATVRLSAEFLESSTALQSQTLVHEMVHCHLFAVDDLARASVEVAASKKAVAMFDVAFTSAIEQATDAFADAFAGLLPPLVLPPLSGS